MLRAWPEGDGWHTRLSVAQITADAPFSRLAGITRWFGLLAGDGVDLEVDAVAHRVSLGGAALCFDGAATTVCRLPGGPTRVFNLMLRHRQGGLEPVQARRPWQPFPGSVGAAGLFGLFAERAGWLQLGQAEGTAPVRVAARSVVWLDGVGQALCFVPDDELSAAPARSGAWWWWSAADAVGAADATSTSNGLASP